MALDLALCEVKRNTWIIFLIFSFCSLKIQNVRYGLFCMFRKHEKVIRRRVMEQNFFYIDMPNNNSS